MCDEIRSGETELGYNLVACISRPVISVAFACFVAILSDLFFNYGLFGCLVPKTSKYSFWFVDAWVDYWEATGTRFILSLQVERRKLHQKGSSAVLHF
jgi:hypothetical protein